jgi:pimeloyl-ACP methyl ester carboxylesterase
MSGQTLQPAPSMNRYGLSPSVLSRRSVLGRTAAFAAALGLGGSLRSSAAEEATPEGATPAATQPGTDWLAEWGPGQKATINGAILYYEVHGDPAGQPVLLLHGGLGNTEDFRNLAPVLVAAGYMVVAMDCRGRGRSTWGDLPITYEQMAADAVGLLDELGIAKTDVVGWSDGAIIALNLAIHHPERLDRVVAYAANYTPEGNQFVESEQLPPFEYFIAAYRRLAPEPGRLEELTEVLDALYEVAPNYSEAELRSITVPVLILDGAEDEFVKAEQPVQMAALIPGATLVIMPGTGHFALWAKPAVFDQIVLDYLAGKAPIVPATPTGATAGTGTPAP